MKYEIVGQYEDGQEDMRSARSLAEAKEIIAELRANPYLIQPEYYRVMTEDREDVWCE